MKTKKRKKQTRMRGSHTNKRGFKKKARGSGNKGGKGMSGSGKRSDQKKTLILKKFGPDYFGKDKVRRGNPKKEFEVINLYQIVENIPTYLKINQAKESKEGIHIHLEKHKILGQGKLDKKLKISAAVASKSAIEKVKAAGGEILFDGEEKRKVKKSEGKENKNKSE